MTADVIMPAPIKRILVANRSEIAIRVFRAASELGLQTIAIYAEEDKLSLHRFKADEAYRVGRGAAGELHLGPLEAYLSIDEIIRVALSAKVDAIHPGYGFLSERPEFAEACATSGILFIGPKPQTMRTLGNKVTARNLAVSVGVPVMPATDPLPDNDEEVKRLAGKVDYPVMLKACWGGGGRGMRPIESEEKLADAVYTAKREAKAAFGKDDLYLEKLVRHARHVEVQILGDTHGNLVHLFERDCSIQRRNQKVIERAPAPYLDGETRKALCDAALAIGRATDYVGAGTVEFLMDVDTGAFYFIEVNPRIQVEHTVTEQVTGLDIVKAQIGIHQGGHLGCVDETGIPTQDRIAFNGHALQCRITTENPEDINGQPRMVKVPNRAVVTTLPARRKAEEGNDAHVAAPMPGAISTVAVKPGQQIKAGDVLLTIEAMKTETALHALRDSTVSSILVSPGQPVDAKDLLVILEP